MKNISNVMKDKFFYLIFFVIILALSRIIPHPPNFTPILASAIMAPMLVKDRWFGIAMPIVAMFISDIIIGFHPYQFVIYSTILIIAFLSPMVKNYTALGIMAVGGSVWFFIVTNFAVWVIYDYEPGNMYTYPKTFEGLIACYIAALPFFKNTLISTCLFTGLITISIKYLDAINDKTYYLIFNLIKKVRNNRS